MSEPFGLPLVDPQIYARQRLQYRKAQAGGDRHLQLGAGWLDRGWRGVSQVLRERALFNIDLLEFGTLLQVHEGRG